MDTNLSKTPAFSENKNITSLAQIIILLKSVTLLSLGISTSGNNKSGDY